MGTAAGLVGCAGAAAAPGGDAAPGRDAHPAQEPGSGASGGTQPSGIPEPELSPEEADAALIAGAIATSGREWLTAWDETACTGESAAEDVRECQVLLMDLADEADAVADLLEEEALVLTDLAEAATAARAAADAATEWLDAWCGAYADPACAEPGAALVDAQRMLDTALDPWLPRSTPDA